MNILNNDKHHIWVLAGLCIILFFLNIHIIPITDGDTAFYAKIAKNIVESGDWLTMHYGDSSTIINKPPLMMWLTAVSFKLFGINDLAVSFWHSVLALLTVIFTYQLAKELFNKRTAFISALILATSAQFFWQARSPLQDIPLTLFVLLAIYTYVLFERTGDLRYFYLSPVFVALAVLSKGPVGLVLPVIILLVHMIINKSKLPKLQHIIAGITLFCAIALPWFIIEYRILGRQFLDVFIGSNVGRYLKPIDTIGNEASKYAKITPQYDFYSFFLQLFILMIPWSGFIYPALYFSFKKRSNSMPAIFALSVILFFSLSLNYKISRYILPAFPALSMIIAGLIDRSSDKEGSKYFIFSSWLTLLLILPLLILATVSLYNSFSKIGPHYAPLFLPFLIMMCLCLLAGSILGISRKFNSSFKILAALSALAYVLLINGLSLYYARLNPMSVFCGKINSLVKQNDIVCQYKGTDAHFMIYYSNNPVILVQSDKEMANILVSRKKAYCVTENEEAFNSLHERLRGQIRILQKSANYTLFSNK